MIRKICLLFSDTDGTASIEYAIIASVVSISIVIAAIGVGYQVDKMYARISQGVADATDNSDP